MLLARKPTATHLHDLGSRQEKEHDGYAAHPVGEVFKEVEKCRLGPLDVVEDDEERPAGGESLEKLPHGPKRLLDARSRRGKTEEPAKPVDNEFRLWSFL